MATGLHTVMECHQLLRYKEGEQLQSTKLELFRSTIIHQTTVEDGSKKIDHLFTVPVQLEEAGIQKKCDVKVCRYVFARCYGIHGSEIDKMSLAIRGAQYRDRVLSADIKKWNDKTVFDFTYSDLEESFDTDVRDSCGADPAMVRAAMAPTSSSMMFCSEWLEKYFELWDQSPDSNLTYLHGIDKAEVYKQYVKEITAIGGITQECEPVHLPDFLELWKNLFPYCVKRPHCDIPGKCNTCYEIDKLRRETECKVVHLQLKKLHALHRGGMFMLERKRYKERVFASLQSMMKGEKKIMSIIIDGMDQNNCKVRT